jgi:VPDSG-CTERM motif
VPATSRKVGLPHSHCAHQFGTAVWDNYSLEKSRAPPGTPILTLQLQGAGHETTDYLRIAGPRSSGSTLATFLPVLRFLMPFLSSVPDVGATVSLLGGALAGLAALRRRLAR